MLLHPYFLLALFSLLLNDFLLKYQFPGLLTGKLSDLAGLFVLPVFLAYFFPKRKYHVFLFTALFFIWFKSSYSESFIGIFSNLFFPVSRVVDPTDLFCLLILIPCWKFIEQKPVAIPAFSSRLLQKGIVLVAFFAFCSTSRSPMMLYESESGYSKKSRSAIEERLRANHITYRIDEKATTDSCHITYVLSNFVIEKDSVYHMELILNCAGKNKKYLTAQTMLGYNWNYSEDSFSKTEWRKLMRKLLRKIK